MIALLAIAHAVPVELAHQGRVFDATSGLPVTGSNTLDVSLYDGETAATPVWQESIVTTFDEGYYSVLVGQNTSLDSSTLDQAELWVGVSVNGGAETGRVRLASVPYARLADTAAVATSVSGGVVDATEIRIGGNVVIDSSGDLAAGSGDGDTLGALSCATGQVALFDGTDWGCATMGWGDLAGIPVGFADGVDDQLDETAVDAYVANNGYALAGDLAAVATSGDFGDLLNVPAFALDADIAAIGKSGSWNDLVDVPSDLSDGTIDWTELTSRPAGLDDGDDDTLAGLGCTTDQIAMHDGTSWGCQTLDAAAIGALDAGGDSMSGLLTLWNDNTIVCDATVEGATRYNGTTMALEFCNGTDWIALGGRIGFEPGAPGDSCLHILTSNPLLPDGTYWIDPLGTGAFQVYCDMTRDGGGWTLIAKTNGNGEGHESPVDNNLANLVDLSSNSGTMGDALRNALGRYYRFDCGSGTRWAYVRDTSASVATHWTNQNELSWNGSYQTDPSFYNENNAPDCGAGTCDGPAWGGRNWMRVGNGGCGLFANYGNSGTWWAK